MVVFGQTDCIRKVVVFEQKLLYSGKVVVFLQSCFIPANLIFSGKSDCIRAIQLYSNKSG